MRQRVDKSTHKRANVESAYQQVNQSAHQSINLPMNDSMSQRLSKRAKWIFYQFRAPNAFTDFNILEY